MTDQAKPEKSTANKRRRLYSAPEEAAVAPEVVPEVEPVAAVSIEPEVIKAAEPTPESQPPSAPPAAEVAPPAPAPSRPDICHDQRRYKAEYIIRDHALLAGGAMAIPIPLLDAATEAGIQLKLIKRLCEHYEVDFAEERAKAVLSAVLGGFSVGWAVGNVLRYASFATYFTSFLPSALIAAALTYAIGQIFVHHFEEGGGLHDMDKEKAAAIAKEKLGKKA